MNFKFLTPILLFLLVLVGLWTAVFAAQREWSLTAEPNPAAALAAPNAAAAPIAPATAGTVAHTTGEQAATQPTTPVRIKSEYLIYDDTLADDWQEWSWSVTSQWDATEPVQQGSAALAVTYDTGWGAFYLHRNTLIKSDDYDLLRFWIHGGSQGGQQFHVVLADDSNSFLSESKAVTAQAGRWTLVEINLNELGVEGGISGIAWQDSTGNAQPTFYLDGLALIDLDLPPTPTPVPSQGPTLQVDLSAERYPIQPGIYGINYAEEALATAVNLPARRWGGNATTRYNWQNDTANRASDWFFENIPEENPAPEELPDNSAANRFIEQDRRTGTQTLLTIPMIGWTPKSRETTCGFSVQRYGPQQQTDGWRPDCGNGLKPNGDPLQGNDPTDTSMAIGPSFVKEWIAYLTARYGTAAEGGVTYYNLDNELMLWHHTHRDVHPEPVGYDELRDLTYTYGAAVKEADPTAQTLGPAAWGWTAYFFSALDGAEGGTWWNKAPDRAAHGGMPLVAWYLQEMQRYEQEKGVRILDYLDLHYYPQAASVALTSAGNVDTRALRLRSTRSLWDSTYTDESWIDEPVQLIPRMREWVDTYYPGTKLALSEYNWGALDHINGAVAQADILGIFGRERLDLAFLWAPLAIDDPYVFAFRMYRNYDGAGSAFGDLSVRATSSNQEQLSIYAAQRSQDQALTVMVINKSTLSLISEVQLTGATVPATAEVYRYSTADLENIQTLPAQAVVNGRMQANFPAQSITLFVLPANSAP
ncbi:MAG: hypothetical protein KF832_20030 [Caldilineaceae bacterium]|nr:hypothetical protein [Caldilineaceae bacterium]